MEPKQAELLVLTQVRKNLGNSHALHKLGITVNVEVCRLAEADGKTLAKEQNPAEVKKLALELARPFYQLRAKHEQDAQNAVGSVTIESQHDAFTDVMRKNYIYPKGGYTKVELVNPLDGKTYTGECHFGIDTIFNRKIASTRAYGKLFSKLLAGSSMGRKRGKSVVKELVS